MTTAENDLEYLATLARLSLATAAQLDQFAELSMRTIRIVVLNALKMRQIAAADAEDVAQEAILRAFKYLPKWKAERAKWATYLSRLTATAIGEQRRQYARQARAVAIARELQRDRLPDNDNTPTEKQ